MNDGTKKKLFYYYDPVPFQELYSSPIDQVSPKKFFRRFVFFYFGGVKIELCKSKLIEFKTIILNCIFITHKELKLMICCTTTLSNPKLKDIIECIPQNIIVYI